MVSATKLQNFMQSSHPPNLIYRKFPTLLPNFSLISHILILLFTVCSVVNSVRASEKPLHQRARNSNFIYKPVIQENNDDDEEKNNDNDADDALWHGCGRSAASSWFAPRSYQSTPNACDESGFAPCGGFAHYQPIEPIRPP